jgi:hypothetical protein
VAGVTPTEACRCAEYPGLGRFEPQQEQDAGHVAIVSTSEPGWSMTYVVACAACGRVFDVEQIDGPALLWRWVPRGEKRKRTRG